MLQLFVRAVFSTVSSKAAVAVTSLRTSRSAFAHWRHPRSKPVEIPPCPRLFRGLHRHLCPRCGWSFHSPEVKDEPFLEQTPSSDWGRRSSSSSPVFSVTLLLAGRNFGGRRRLKQQRKWKLGQLAGGAKWMLREVGRDRELELTKQFAATD